MGVVMKNIMLPTCALVALLPAIAFAQAASAPPPPVIYVGPPAILLPEVTLPRELASICQRRVGKIVMPVACGPAEGLPPNR